MNSKEKQEIIANIKVAIQNGIRMRLTYIPKKKNNQANTFIEFFKLKGKYWLVGAEKITEEFDETNLDDGLKKFLEIGYGKANSWNNRESCYYGKEQTILENA